MAKQIIVYENAIVTFLDILGFGDLVQNSSADKIASLLRAVEEYAKPDKDESEVLKPIVHTFSDTIIRIRPVERDENRKYPMGLLFIELLDLVHIQINLLQHNVLLRGAVGFGEEHSSDTQVFGPAIIRAYELENRSAIYPRIIVDPLLLQEFENNKLLRSFNKFEDEWEEVYGLLKEGDDGFWFVDYLSTGCGECDLKEDWVCWICDFKNLIVKGANEQDRPDKVVQKYRWLARYLNSHVRNLDQDWFRERDLDIEELFITETDIPSLRNTEKLAERY